MTCDMRPHSVAADPWREARGATCFYRRHAANPAALLELTKANAPYVVAGAVVGLTSIQMIILRGIIQLTRRRLIAVSSSDEAFARLAAEAGAQGAV